MKNILDTRTSRREFVKRSLTILPALPFVGKILYSGPAQAQPLPTKALDPANPTAVALGYVTDATKADTVKFPKRKDPGGDKQFCNSCLLLQQRGLKADGQGGEWGKCAVFIDGLVNVNGWCNSWTPKA
jgi:hypothetical protein